MTLHITTGAWLLRLLCHPTVVSTVLQYLLLCLLEHLSLLTPSPVELCISLTPLALLCALGAWLLLLAAAAGCCCWLGRGERARDDFRRSGCRRHA